MDLRPIIYSTSESTIIWSLLNYTLFVQTGLADIISSSTTTGSSPKGKGVAEEDLFFPTRYLIVKEPHRTETDKKRMATTSFVLSGSASRTTVKPPGSVPHAQGGVMPQEGGLVNKFFLKVRILLLGRYTLRPPCNINFYRRAMTLDF